MHTPLTFAAEADTDIWKKPPAHDVFTGKTTHLTSHYTVFITRPRATCSFVT